MVDRDCPDTAAIPARLADLRERVAEAAERAGRDPGEVGVMLATKTQPPELIALAVRAGFPLIGENRVQEITAKAAALSRLLAGVQYRTEMIGNLQRNKVNAVLGRIQGLQSLDSAELAERLDRRLAVTEQGKDAEPRSRRLDVMVQVNVSGEPTKAGVPPDRAAQLIDRIAGLPRLRLTGLMTIGLNSSDSTAVRAGYARLRALRDRLLPAGELSMGMSGDFALAIAEGATIVRLGSAVFGARAVA